MRRDAQKVLADIETGADLVSVSSGTDIGGNAPIHKGNMATDLDADSVDGIHGVDMDRTVSSGRTSHYEIDQLALEAWWTCNDGGGSNVDDMAHSAMHADLKSGVSWTTGRNGGNALAFDGTSSAYCPIHTKSYSSAGVLDQYTICGWFNESSSTAAVMPLVYDRSDYFRFALNDGNGNIHHAYTGSGGTTVDHTYAASVYDGTWHFVAITFDKNRTSESQIYVDGVVVSSQDSLAGGVAVGSGTNERWGFIGANSEAAAFDGSHTTYMSSSTVIDEMRYYENRALSTSELDAIYNGNA